MPSVRFMRRWPNGIGRAPSPASSGLRADSRGPGLPELPGFGVAATMLERITATAQVGLAYGEPKHVGGRTIIPIGAVGYGFGFGGGGGSAERTATKPAGSGGGGGGGGVSVRPVAYLEVTPQGVKLRPVLDWTRIITAAIAVGAALLVRRGRGSRSDRRQPPAAG